MADDVIARLRGSYTVLDDPQPGTDYDDVDTGYVNTNDDGQTPEGE